MNRVGIVATVSLILLVVVAAVLGARTSSVSMSELQIGDCFELPIENWDGAIRSVDLLECSDALQRAALPEATRVAALVVYVGDLNPQGEEVWVGQAASNASADSLCADALPEMATVLPVAPDEELWAHGGRTICLDLGR